MLFNITRGSSVADGLQTTFSSVAKKRAKYV